MTDGSTPAGDLPGEAPAGGDSPNAGAHDPRTLVARLFGRLLLRELDRPTLVELQAPAIAAALAATGIEVPGVDVESADCDAVLEELGAQFFSQVLHPAGRGPLVHSLYREGKYDGDAAADVRKVAKGAGLELADGARGAAPDHLGCLLTLWAELRDRDAEFAQKFGATHLTWVARSPAAAGGPGFYGALLRAVADLCDEIVGSPA
ncbi:MAG: molecular chaperone TorD family protein [bacterium]|nr:molecular chaperone TorD family protein [bacterium]